MAAGVVPSKSLSLDLGVNVETEVLCQIHEWVLEPRLCAGPMKSMVLSSKAIPAVDSGTGYPVQWGQQGHSECLLFLGWTWVLWFLTLATITHRRLLCEVAMLGEEWVLCHPLSLVPRGLSSLHAWCTQL